MKVLLLTQYFAPEIGATQNRMAAFASALAAAGHEVEVLTEVPNHPSGIVSEAFRRRWIYREESGVYRITRVWVVAAVRKTFLTRAAFYLSYLTMAIAAAASPRRRYDVVVATTPPLTVAVAGLILSRLKRAPFVVDVRDLWPEAAVALGELRKGPLYTVALWLAHRVYRGAAAITATTDPFCAQIAAVLGSPVRVTHVPNGTEPELFAPDPVAGEATRQRFGLGGFVVGYVGLHGLAQNLEVLLDAAALTPDVTYLFVGAGPRKALLMEAARSRALANVRFEPEVDVARVRSVFSAADALVVPLSPDPVFVTFIPSKMFDAMAAARPVLLLVDGEARAILERAGAGIFVPPGDARRLAEAVERLRDDAAVRGTMGAAGRRFVAAHYDRHEQARQFAAVVTRAAGPR